MLFKGTRFTNTPAYIINGGALVLDIREQAQFNMSNATFYTFVEGDTVDGVAYKQYGNAALWWAIMDANPQFQHEIEIKPGDLIAIPPYDEVIKWL